MKKWAIFLLVMTGTVAFFARESSAFLCVEPIPPSVTYSPGALDFGSTPSGVAKTLSVIVTYHSQRQFLDGVCVCRCGQAPSATITLSGSPSANFSANPASFTLGEEQSKTVQMTFNPRGSAGIFNGSITAATTAGPQTFPLSVSGVSYAGVSNIQISPSDIDFGPTEIGTFKTRLLTLSNLGTATLTGTLSASAPFSSLAPTFSIAPGGNAVVGIRFAPTASGPVAGILQINSNDPDAGNLPLSLTGTGATPALVVVPSSLDFGTIPEGESLSKTVTIYNASCSSCADALTLDLSNFQSSKPGFSVVPPADTSLAPGESTTMQVVYSPTASNQKSSSISFQTTDPLYPTKTIAAAGESSASSLDPSTMNINFGSVHLGTTGVQSVTIHNTGSASYTVSSVVPSSARVTATPGSFTLAAGASQTIQVRYTPVAATSLNLTTEVLNGTLTINSNDGGLAHLVLDMAGKAVSPLISAMPLDFGTVYEGTPVTGTLNVKNSGNETLSVTSVVSNNAVLTPLETSFSVPAGGEHALPVRYNPTSEGSQSATITAVSNDYFTPSLGMTAAGVAVSALDLSVDHLEITQAVQTPGNDLDLVAGKTTAVRTFVSSTIRGAPNVSNAIRNIDGLLHVRKNGAEISGSPLKSSNGPITVVAHPDRNKAGDTLNFTVPGSWLTGADGDAWSFTVDLNPASGARVSRATENSYANNTASQPVKFWNNYRPSIFYIPISLQGRPLPIESKMSAGADLLKKMFPVASVDYVRRPPIAFNGDVNLHDQFLKLSAQLFYASHLGVASPPDRTYGWVSEQAESLMKYLGIAEDIPGRVAYGGGLSNPASAQEIFAHEIGHTYGLCHTHILNSCPGGYSDGHTLEDGAIQETGYDVTDGTTVTPVAKDTYLSCCADVTCSDGTRYKNCAGFPIPSNCTATHAAGSNCSAAGAIDFMAYKQNSGQRAWIHPKRYESLFLRLRTKESDPSNARGCNTNPEVCSQPAFLIAGSIHDDGSASLHPLFLAQGAPDEPDSAETDYSVRGIDEAGNALFTYPLVLADHTAANEEKTPGSAFSAVVPADPDLKSVQIVKDGAVLSEQARSEHAPVLTLKSPVAGASVGDLLDVSWDAADEDGDFLTYSVLYSRDGGQGFQAIGVDLYSNRFQYDASQLPGGDAAVVRVVASDGFHTVTADSPAFSVASKPPAIHVLSPKDGETVFSGIPVSLEAVSSDAEDGTLPGSAIHWTSDIQGDLGDGSPAVALLKPGVHVITARVSDSEGHESQDVLTLRISNGADAPHADAGEDQTISEGEATVLDASRTFDPNEGDTLAYDWTQVSGPSVLLDDDTAVRPSFTAPKVGQDEVARFLLTVTDNSGNVATDLVDITILNAHFASLQISETDLDFGTANIGDSVRRPLTLSNNGDETLIVSNLRLSREVFGASTGSLTIAPGSSADLWIDFHPNEKAAYESSVWVESNSIGGVPKTVILKATTPQPEKFYNDNGPGGSLLPAGFAASPSPDLAPTTDVNTPGAGAGGCSLTNR